MKGAAYNPGLSRKQREQKRQRKKQQRKHPNRSVTRSRKSTNLRNVDSSSNDDSEHSSKQRQPQQYEHYAQQQQHHQQQQQHHRQQYGSMPPKRKSTNPFDDDSSSDENCTIFFDCIDDSEYFQQQQYETSLQRIDDDHHVRERQSLLSGVIPTTKRSAPLNFDPDQNIPENKPALNLNQRRTNTNKRSGYFISPLESALLAWKSPTNFPHTSLVDDDDHNRIESISNHDTNGNEKDDDKNRVGSHHNSTNNSENDSIGSSESQWARLIRIASSASSLFLQGQDTADDDDQAAEQNTTHSHSSSDEHFLGMSMTEDENSLGLDSAGLKFHRKTSDRSPKSSKSSCGNSDGDDLDVEDEMRDNFVTFTPPPHHFRNNSNWHGAESSFNNNASNASSRKMTHSSSVKTNLAPSDKNPILQKLHTFPKDSEFTMDYRSPGTPWTHLIILEDLGTAASWAILLLPYVAFLICVILDSDSALQIQDVGPFNATSPCISASSGSVGYDVPLEPTPPVSCSYPFTLSNRQGILSYGDKGYALVRSHYKALLPTGTAFASGPIPHVPASSDFLYGDATYQNLPTEIVAMVAQGQVVLSAVVLQRTYGDEHEEEWSPVKITKPARLSMQCQPANYDTQGVLSSAAASSPPVTWDCSSPRILDVLCAEPGTATLTGTDLQINILYSHVRRMNTDYQLLDFSFADVDDIYQEEYSYVLSKSADLKSMLLRTNVTSDPYTLISEMVQSSSYTIQHERPLYETIEIVVRLGMLFLSLIFIGGWCWSLGLKGFFGRDIIENKWFWFPCRCAWKRNKQTEALPLTLQKNKMLPWWESPWLLLPERRYLLILLFCLLLIQNPLLAYAYFHPWMYSKASFHSAADALMGIGVHGILMLWLCLFQGLRYHSASISRKRAKQQRQALELRRAAKYIAQADHTQYGTGTEDSISRYTASYYEQYGDVDGSGSSGDLHLRLKHDPCGDNWADFLLPKLFLFVCGAASVILTAIYRFPASQNMATLSPRLLHRYSTTYVVSSFVQLTILVLWVVLIIRNAFMTGAKLRKEPFLSTRPAQLAFRVLSCILLLGMAALALPFFLDFYYLMKPWSFGNDTRDVNNEEIHARGNSALDIALQVLFRVSERFPYSGTAASIGPGKILFATVCALVAAFIFLPSRSFFEDELDATEQRKRMIGGGGDWTGGALAERVRQRRDKRLVVTLARYTHTWRVFPLPIKKNSILASELLSGGAFHVNQDFQVDYGTNNNSRGVGYINRYMPVFCVETACWLLEASWQSYYSPMEFSTSEMAPGRMSLENIGLRLENAIYDETTHTQAIVATNIDRQVDGEEDSIIVVAFRGTINATNLRTDFNWRQVPLPETFLGNEDQTTFRVHTDHIDASGYEGWDSWIGVSDKSPKKTTSPSSTSGQADPETEKNSPSIHSYSPRPLPTDTITWKQERPSGFSAVSSGAKAAIRATPFMRHNLPFVHEGFLHSYSNIRKQLWLSILPILQRQLSKSVMLAMTTPRSNSFQGNSGMSDTERPLALPKIYITGHSLGGSLGQLLAMDLASNCELVIQNAQRAATTEDEVFTLAGLFEEPSIPVPPPPPIPPPRTVDALREESFDAIFQDSTDVPIINDKFSSPSQNDRKHFFADDEADSTVPDGYHQHHDNGPNKLYLQPAIALYSYGQPRVGNRAFAKMYKQRVPHTFRVVNEGDITTSLPNLATSGGLYKHAGLEVMLDEGCTGNILVGPTIVETLFRFSKVRTSVTAHALERYRECLESSLGPDELLEYYNTHGLDGTHSDSRSSMDRGGNGSCAIPMSASKTKLPGWVTQIKRSDGGF